MSVNKGGRPVERDSVKRFPLSLRTSAEMRQQVEAAAERSGRSLAQEIEHRLELSFEKDNVLHGSHNHNFFSMALAVVAEIERQRGVAWPDDREAAWAVKAAVNRLIDGCTASDLDALPPESAGKFRELISSNSEAGDAVAIAKTGAALLSVTPALGSAPSFNSEAVDMVRQYIADAEAKVAQAEEAASAVASILDAHKARERAATSFGEGAALEWLRARGPKRERSR